MTVHGTYADIAGLFSGTLPASPEPDFLTRLDGHGLLYGEAVNSVFGEPEGGKTWLSLAAIAEELRSPVGRGLFLDLDHNGVRSVANRLVGLGAPRQVLADPQRFRYAEPEGANEVMAVVADCEEWRPTIVVIDSVGELVPLFRGDSNSSDDYTRVHRQVATRLAKLGACVVLIDHVSKSTESQRYGATGTGAKRRAIDGAALRVRIRSAFTPGRGGSAVITVNKDRHGGVREHAHLDEGSKEPTAGIFEMGVGDGSSIAWKLRAPLAGERLSESAPLADVTALAALDPQPETVRDVKERMGWGSNRANAALKGLRAGEHLTIPVPEEQERNTERAADTSCSPFPDPYTQEQRNTPDQHEQETVPHAFPAATTETQVPGDVTENTPGLTPRVLEILGKGHQR
ncbi:AAA family ATPase [Gordonia westfalica]|uniref:RecA/RadA recombinase n=1 Tax=Gordonia westfalica TaxID=158898 RepID=A0A1H2IGI4_9ACTN|nr:AAA family ATPase [Gordonia westfalica]SDU43095.1 RecA/RadA recombinase [Gordonia westfalica]